MEEKDNGRRLHAHVVEALDDFNKNIVTNPDYIKFRCSVNNDEYEEILSFCQIMDHLETDLNNDVLWKFKSIIAHEGPLSQNHPSWKGSRFNVMIEWENGEISSEPLSTIVVDDPITCAIYAKENQLLGEPRWKQFKSIAKSHKKFLWMIHQAKLCSFR